MLQIAVIRENKEKVIAALAKKNMDAKAIVEEVIQLDENRRAAQVELDTTLSESNKLSKDIGALMKNGEKAKAEILKQKTVQLRDQAKSISDKIEVHAADLLQKMYLLPNLPADIVPEGKTAEENLNVFEEYINHHGEYEGIKEFTKNYLSLKIVDNVKLEEIKLNNVLKVNFSE